MSGGLEDSDTMAMLEAAGLWCIRMADGSLNEEEEIAFEVWLNQSDAHRTAFEDTVRTWHAAGQMGLDPQIMALRAAAFEEYGAPDPQQSRSLLPRRAPARWLALAASVLILMLGYAIHAHFAFDSYSTGMGERRIVTLEDGSRLSLDAETEVKVRYGADKRDLRLMHGRAKFQVSKDPLRPFAVTAGSRVVVATGTEFSVELLNTQVRVILFEGHVAVLDEDRKSAISAFANPSGNRRRAAASIEGLQLNPGTELVTERTSGRDRLQRIDTGASATWEAGLLTFEDEPIADAVARVNRYSATHLAVDPAARQARINGVFTAGDTAAFVEGTLAVHPLKVEIRNGIQTFVK